MFFSTAVQFRLELQMTPFFRRVRSAKDIITGSHSELAKNVGMMKKLCDSHFPHSFYSEKT